MRLLPLLFAATLTFAQDAERVFRLTHASDPRQMQEIATVIRSAADIKTLSVVPSSQALAFTGSKWQIQLAEWLAGELDRPAASPPDEAVREHTIEGQPDDVVRILFTPYSSTPQHLQEIATTVRTITDIRRVLSYNSPSAIIVRGTREQIDLAQWLLQALDPRSNSPRQYQMAAGGDDSVRVFSLKHAVTPQTTQELAVAIRTTSDIRRVLTVNTPPTIIVRGTRDQAALAEWMIRSLDLPTAATAEFRLPNDRDDLVRVFPISPAATPQALQEVNAAVRATTNIRRMTTLIAPQAIVARATQDQIAMAERLIKELSARR